MQATIAINAVDSQRTDQVRIVTIWPTALATDSIEGLHVSFRSKNPVPIFSHFYLSDFMPCRIQTFFN